MSKQTRSVLLDLELILKNAQVPSPRFDTESIVAFVLGIERSRLGLIQQIDDEQYCEIKKLIEKRQRRIPLQHLLNEQGFRRIILEVGQGVFIPRPETELLVESSIRYLNNLGAGPKTVIDYCAGSGAIALSVAMEVENTLVFAVEKSEVAFDFLTRNFNKYKQEIEQNNSQVVLINKSIIDEIAEVALLEQQVDAVLSNPPYIPEKMIPKEPEVKDHEPEMALFGGKDGLDIVRVVIEKASSLLKPGGFVAIEHADVQGSSTEESGVPYLMIKSNNFEKIEDKRDLNGLSRYCIGIKK